MPGCIREERGISFLCFDVFLLLMLLNSLIFSSLRTSSQHQHRRFGCVAWRDSHRDRPLGQLCHALAGEREKEGGSLVSPPVRLRQFSQPVRMQIGLPAAWILGLHWEMGSKGLWIAVAMMNLLQASEPPFLK